MSINSVPSITRVADAGLFAEHIFPLVLQPKDKCNCMLVCKQWYSQMRTSSAWRHVRTVRVFNNNKGKRPVLTMGINHGAIITVDEVWLNIMTEQNERGVVLDEHVLSLLQLCTNIRMIDWRVRGRLSCDGVDTLIGWLDEGKLLWPKLSLIKFDFDNSVDDLQHNLAKCDNLLSTTFEQVQSIGMTFRPWYTELTEQQQQQHRRDCTNAFVTLLSHHVHKLHQYILRTESYHEHLVDQHTSLLSSGPQTQPTALRVLQVEVDRASDEHRQMLIDLINLQRGTLTELYIRIDNRSDWCAFLNGIERCAVQNLESFGCVGANGNELPNVCALLADKCENLIRLSAEHSVTLTLAEFTTIVRHFTNDRKKFTLHCPRIDTRFGTRIEPSPKADQLATALRDQFDAQLFDGNVEKINDTFRFTVNQCEFVFEA